METNTSNENLPSNGGGRIIPALQLTTESPNQGTPDSTLLDCSNSESEETVLANLRVLTGSGVGGSSRLSRHRSVASDYYRRSSIGVEHLSARTNHEQNSAANWLSPTFSFGRRRSSHPKICTFECAFCRKAMLTSVSERNISALGESNNTSDEGSGNGNHELARTFTCDAKLSELQTPSNKLSTPTQSYNNASNTTPEQNNISLLLSNDSETKLESESALARSVSATTTTTLLGVATATPAAAAATTAASPTIIPKTSKTITHELELATTYNNEQNKHEPIGSLTEQLLKMCWPQESGDRPNFISLKQTIHRLNE